MLQWDVEIIPASFEHIAPIAQHMRQADRDEVWAAARASPRQALEYSLNRSSFAFTGCVGGEPVVMFGVGDVNILAGMGAPWALGTDGVAKNAKVFLRQSRKWRDEMSKRYVYLGNFVDGRNEVSIRWLKWLGFELKEPVEMNGAIFYPFEMKQEAWSVAHATGKVKQEAWRGEAPTGKGLSYV